MRIIVDHLRGSRAGQRQEFRGVDRIRFGRHPDNEVSFDTHRDLDASSRHAELRRDGDLYVLVDVGSSNGTLVKGEPVGEHTLELTDPTRVEFGAEGPAIQIWLGTDSDTPPPVPRPAGDTFTDLLRNAREQARGQSAVRAANTFAKSFSSGVLSRASMRTRLLLFLLVAGLIVGVVVALLWAARERERREEAEAEAARQRQWQERDEALRQAEPNLPSGAPGREHLPDQVAPALIYLHAPAEWVRGQKQAPPKWFCTAFAVAERTLVTTDGCAELAEEGFRWRARRAFGVTAAGARIDFRRIHRSEGGRVARIETVAALETVLPLAEDVREGAELHLVWQGPAPAGDTAPEVQSAIGVVALDPESGEIRHDLAAPGEVRGAPLITGDGSVVAVHGGGRDSSPLVDAIRAAMGENDRR